MEEIIRATPRPQYISKLAEEFIEQEMSQRFLAIHGRKRAQNFNKLTLLVSLRSATLSEVKYDNKLVTLPARVKTNFYLSKTNPKKYDRKDFLSKNRCKKYIKSERKRRGLLSYDQACKEFYPLRKYLSIFPA